MRDIRSTTRRRALLNYQRGTGYNIQYAVINLNLDKDDPLPGPMEDQVDDHIMGLLFAHQYTLERY